MITRARLTAVLLVLQRVLWCAIGLALAYPSVRSLLLWLAPEAPLVAGLFVLAVLLTIVSLAFLARSALAYRETQAALDEVAQMLQDVHAIRERAVRACHVPVCPPAPSAQPPIEVATSALIEARRQLVLLTEEAAGYRPETRAGRRASLLLAQADDCVERASVRILRLQRLLQRVPPRRRAGGAS